MAETHIEISAFKIGLFDLVDWLEFNFSPVEYQSETGSYFKGEGWEMYNCVYRFDLFVQDPRLATIFALKWERSFT